MVLPPSSENDVDNSAEKALGFVVQCRDNRSRGPYLAHLQLILDCQQHSDKTCRAYGERTHSTLCRKALICFKYLILVGPENSVDKSASLQIQNFFVIGVL